MMSDEQEKLWFDIQAFRFDEPDAEFPFSKRLAYKNGWSHFYALRVIDEYRKFIFLCCVCNHSVTPSKAVDEAWHLHLCYTHSYWDVLCGEILRRDIHHVPTQGGAQEATKHKTQYTATLNSYYRFFGETPPSDVWGTDEELSDTPLSWNFDDKRVRTTRTKKHFYLIIAAIVCITLVAVILNYDSRWQIISIGTFVSMIVLALSKNESSGHTADYASGCGDGFSYHGDSHDSSADCGDSGCGSD